MRHERVKGSEAEAQLARALAGSAHAAGVAMAIERHASRPWASATFVGAQHLVVLAASPGAALDAWAAALPEAELAMRGHLVASLAVEAIDPRAGRLTLAALTLEDA